MGFNPITTGMVSAVYMYVKQLWLHTMQYTVIAFMK